MQPVYDAVLTVSPLHCDIARIAIQQLVRNAQPRTVYVITTQQNFVRFAGLNVGQLRLVDEDQLIPSVDLGAVKGFLSERGANAGHAGWYFQQFLKMAACTLQDIAPHYLIWDADTIMLRTMSFFDDDGRALVAMQREYNPEYFRTYKRLLNMERSATFSFIAEHMMVRTTFMRELIQAIDKGSLTNGQWVWAVLSAIDESKLSYSAFSEFETYGNYVNSTHRDSMAFREIRSLRAGAGRFGTLPNRCDLYRLSRKYYYASFESIHRQQSYILRIWLEKMLSVLVYPAYHWTARGPTGQKKVNLR